MQGRSSSAAESTTSSIEEELVDALEAAFGVVVTPVRSQDLSSDHESNGSEPVPVLPDLSDIDSSSEDMAIEEDSIKPEDYVEAKANEIFPHVKRFSPLAVELKSVTTFDASNKATSVLFTTVHDVDGSYKVLYDYYMTVAKPDEHGLSKDVVSIRKILYAADVMRKPVNMKDIASISKSFILAIVTYEEWAGHQSRGLNVNSIVETKDDPVLCFSLKDFASVATLALRESGLHLLFDDIDYGHIFFDVVNPLWSNDDMRDEVSSELYMVIQCLVRGSIAKTAMLSVDANDGFGALRALNQAEQLNSAPNLLAMTQYFKDFCLRASEEPSHKLAVFLSTVKFYNDIRLTENIRLGQSHNDKLITKLDALKMMKNALLVPRKTGDTNAIPHTCYNSLYTSPYYLLAIII